MEGADAEKRLQHHRQMEALGQLAGGMAQDLNNLLSASLAHLDLVEEGLGPEAEGVWDDLAELRRNTVTCSRMVKHLLSFSRGDRLQVEPVQLDEVVQNAVGLVRSILPEDTSVDVAIEDVGRVLADPSAVEKMVLALASRARDAMDGGGRLEISVRSGSLDRDHARRTGWGDPGEYGVISVKDDGRGMSPETVERLFQPFFVSREEGGEGPVPGLSMSMVYGLMKQHRGFIEVQSEPEAGTSVRLYFRPERERATVATAAPEAPEPGRGTVLFVEDEESLLNVGCKILASQGYRALQATDGFEALEIIEREGVPDLLVTDLVMPSMTGVELIQRLEGEGRLPNVLLTSGFQPDLFLEWHRDPSAFPFLEKPWTVEGFVEAVRELVPGEAGPPP